MNRFLTTLKPILGSEIGNLTLVNHLPNMNELNTTQLISCLAESVDMTILHHPPKDTILQKLAYSCLVQNKIATNHSIPNTSQKNDIDTSIDTIKSSKYQNLQMQKDSQSSGHIASLDEEANHSPPKLRRISTQEGQGIHPLEVPALELSNDTLSNSRPPKMFYGHMQETNMDLKTPGKVLISENSIPSSTADGASSTYHKSMSNRDVKKGNDASLSILERECKTPIKHRSSGTNNRHPLAAMQSPYKGPLSSKNISHNQVNKIVPFYI